MSRILMVTPEAAPFAKTGGLADVLGALPQALAHRGEQVAVVLPMYSRAGTYPENAPVVYSDLYVWLGPAGYITHIRRHSHEGVDYYFVQEPNLFGREGLYGEGGTDYPDNHVRFAVFCQAAVAIIRYLFRPDVVHCHDWQAGLVPVVMRHHFRLDPTFYGLKVLFTIHNMGYQGLFPSEAARDIGLDGALLRPDLLEFWGSLNMLKGGLVFSDWLSTVSKGYAREIQTAEFGFGLDGLLRARSSTLSGILNGVDYREWSPEADPHLPANYSPEKFDGKRDCKLALLAEFGLPEESADRPLIGIVSRFVHQKGFDLIAEIGDQLGEEELSLVALGTGEPQFEEALTALASRYPGKIAVRIAYDNALAHRIEAGSDMFLMPSQYEPCGLNQIYSLRYGTIPIVRATGGLDDTIDEETGFKFHEYSGAALLAAVRSALDAYRDRARWLRMMYAAMQRDFSWDASAAEYSTLYASLAGRESFRLATSSH